MGCFCLCVHVALSFGLKDVKLQVQSDENLFVSVGPGLLFLSFQNFQRYFTIADVFNVAQREKNLTLFYRILSISVQ